MSPCSIGFLLLSGVDGAFALEAEAINELEALVEAQPELELFVASLKSAERGIIR